MGNTLKAHLHLNALDMVHESKRKECINIVSGQV